jgi:hypothetical protein
MVAAMNSDHRPHRLPFARHRFAHKINNLGFPPGGGKGVRRQRFSSRFHALILAQQPSEAFDANQGLDQFMARGQQRDSLTATNSRSPRGFGKWVAAGKPLEGQTLADTCPQLARHQSPPRQNPAHLSECEKLRFGAIPAGSEKRRVLWGVLASA